MVTIMFIYDLKVSIMAIAISGRTGVRLGDRVRLRVRVKHKS